MSHRIRMEYRKATPGTYVFENRDDPYIKTLYVAKRAFTKLPVHGVMITLEEIQEVSAMTEKDLS